MNENRNPNVPPDTGSHRAEPGQDPSKLPPAGPAVTSQTQAGQGPPSDEPGDGNTPKGAMRTGPNASKHGLGTNG